MNRYGSRLDLKHPRQQLRFFEVFILDNVVHRVQYPTHCFLVSVSKYTRKFCKIYRYLALVLAASVTVVESTRVSGLFHRVGLLIEGLCKVGKVHVTSERPSPKTNRPWCKPTYYLPCHLPPKIGWIQRAPCPSPVDHSHTSNSTAAILHSIDVCHQNEARPPPFTEMNAGALIEHHLPYEANTPSPGCLQPS